MLSDRRLDSIGMRDVPNLTYDIDVRAITQNSANKWKCNTISGSTLKYKSIDFGLK